MISLKLLFNMLIGSAVVNSFRSTSNQVVTGLTSVNNGSIASSYREAVKFGPCGGIGPSVMGPSEICVEECGEFRPKTDEASRTIYGVQIDENSQVLGASSDEKGIEIKFYQKNEVKAEDNSYLILLRIINSRLEYRNATRIDKKDHTVFFKQGECSTGLILKCLKFGVFNNRIIILAAENKLNDAVNIFGGEGLVVKMSNSSDIESFVAAMPEKSVYKPSSYNPSNTRIMNIIQAERVLKHGLCAVHISAQGELDTLHEILTNQFEGLKNGSLNLSQVLVSNYRALHNEGEYRLHPFKNRHEASVYKRKYYPSQIPNQHLSHSNHSSRPHYKNRS